LRINIYLKFAHPDRDSKRTNHEVRKPNSNCPCRKAWNLAGEDKPVFEPAETAARKNQIHSKIWQIRNYNITKPKEFD